MISVRSVMLGLAAFAVVSPVFAGWKAGTASTTITPQGPLWMAGYGSRKAPSAGVLQDLWAKCLVVEDPAGRKGVLIALEICGIDRDTAGRMAREIEKGLQVPRERIVITCSHTHCGPVVGSNLQPMYPIDDAERARIAAYTRSLERKVVAIAIQAGAALGEVELAFGIGREGFAVNRRENREQEVPARRASLQLAGPVDHDVPVLALRKAEGELAAVVFGYACHNTTLDINKFSGDYAGFAQAELERAHPGATAFFVAGCGADQNPVPRRQVARAESYGRRLAQAVERTLAGPLERISGGFECSYQEVPLAFQRTPSRAELERDAGSTNFYVASRARLLLAKIKAAGALEPTYPYPVQVWRLGDLEWIFLGGEVVVDYAHKIKRNRDPARTWVAAYCNDVMAYIPSLRVLREGGYEGGGAMLYYGLPSRWREDVEDVITAAIARGLRSVAP